MSSAVVIGRFQPVHAGHLELFRAALSRAEMLIIVLGSANGPRSLRNPFTPAERRELITLNLRPDEMGRVRFVEVRDYFYNNTAWTNEVLEKVEREAGNVAISLFGHVKDPTSAYLKWFPNWPLIEAPSTGSFDATTLRQAYLRDGYFTSAGLSEPTRAWLTRFSSTPSYARLHEEQIAIDKYKASWAAAPFPPVFVTADAVVTCGGHVLMIQRKRSPGKGLWALPGGFLNPDETIAAAAVRELYEETSIQLPPAEVASSLEAVRVFDHPLRSSRGRTITHAHLFRLTRGTLPRVQAQDDAEAVRWIPLLDLGKMEAEVFEDHFYILAAFGE